MEKSRDYSSIEWSELGFLQLIDSRGVKHSRGVGEFEHSRLREMIETKFAMDSSSGEEDAYTHTHTHICFRLLSCRRSFRLETIIATARSRRKSRVGDGPRKSSNKFSYSGRIFVGWSSRPYKTTLIPRFPRHSQAVTEEIP